jgi:ribosomal protein L40E
LNPFAIIIGILLLAGSLFYVAAPLRPGVTPVKLKKQASKTSQSLQADHQAVILALRDLDFDYQAGKISEEDYPGIRASLLEKAAFTLKEVEESSDAQLEKLIQARRKQQSSASDLSETRNSNSGSLICAKCQSPLAIGANFCMKCGTAVSRAFCPHCGKPIQPDDQFCPACGKAVTNQSPP